MMLGMRTAIYPSPDLQAARAWYSKVLDTPPHFDQPYYVGHVVGGFEIGLIPDRAPGAAGTQAYWGVDDIHAELARLPSLGATPHDDARQVGDGAWVASVLDPSGNVLGLIRNPMFDPAKVR